MGLRSRYPFKDFIVGGLRLKTSATTATGPAPAEALTRSRLPQVGGSVLSAGIKAAFHKSAGCIWLHSGESGCCLHPPAWSFGFRSVLSFLVLHNICSVGPGLPSGIGSPAHHLGLFGTLLDKTVLRVWNSLSEILGTLCANGTGVQASCPAAAVTWTPGGSHVTAPQLAGCMLRSTLIPISLLTALSSGDRCIRFLLGRQS